ncbi:MAG: HAD hydrolase-like protein [Anaerolineae bacterium]|nr:HAD hydrolase-like protein [Anaerolineae bacterium]
MTPHTLVLFDIDGTLLHASGIGRLASERALIEIFGTAGTFATYQLSGKTDWYTLRHLLIPEGFTDDAIERAIPRYADALGRHMVAVREQFKITPLPGALELVRALRARPDVVIGIITGNMPPAATVKLEAAGFDLDDFAIAVYGSEAPVRRQLMPLAIDRAEKHCSKRFTPLEIAIIGDTPEDIDCAHSIGARAIAVATGINTRAELEQHPPVVVLDDLSDLDAALTAVLGDAR